MKIAFVGTHGVGKTTLSYELAALLKKRGLDVELVKEVARTSPLPINRETSRLAQLWILHTQIAREIELEARHQIVVCDRSVLDNYAYLLHAAGADPVAERIVDDWLPTYGLLLRVPAVGRPQKDGVRDTDLDFQLAIDGSVPRLLGEKRIPFVDLAPLPRSKWIVGAVEAVVAALRGRREGAEPERDQLALFGGEA